MQIHHWHSRSMTLQNVSQSRNGNRQSSTTWSRIVCPFPPQKTKKNKQQQIPVKAEMIKVKHLQHNEEHHVGTKQPYTSHRNRLGDSHCKSDSVLKMGQKGPEEQTPNASQEDPSVCVRYLQLQFFEHTAKELFTFQDFRASTCFAWA